MKRDSYVSLFKDLYIPMLKSTRNIPLYKTLQSKNKSSKKMRIANLFSFRHSFLSTGAKVKLLFHLYKHLIMFLTNNVTIYHIFRLPTEHSHTRHTPSAKVTSVTH